jgi:plastocyanin
MRLAGALALSLAAALPAAAAGLRVDVRDARGGAVNEAVVYAVPEGRKVRGPAGQAVIDQKNRTFVPHVLPVQVGTPVLFPNSDNVRHQVYSFSPAKTFQLPLYSGTPAAPVVFDRAGVVALGCNIHDHMSAYIVVVETPYFATTTNGEAVLSHLPEGQYALRIWYAGMRREPAPQMVALAAHEQKDAAFRIGTP